MGLNQNSSVAELRTELDFKRRKARELRAATEDADERMMLSDIFWELRDLDIDLYHSQFIKNNERLSVLTGHLENAVAGAEKVIATLENISEVLQSSRGSLNEASVMFGELGTFYSEVEGILESFKSA